MRLLKIENRYYHILHQVEFNMFGVNMEYVILQDGKVLYLTPHDWWGNKKFWTLEEVSEKLKKLESTRFRNSSLKEDRLRHWSIILQHMIDYTRDSKIEEIIKQDFIWKFA